jgi:adenylate cyclase
VEYLLDILPRIDRAAVLLIDNKTQIKDVISRSREDQPNDSVSYGRVVVDQVLRDGNTISIADTSDMTSSEMMENMDTLKIKSVLCVPMTAHSKIRGAIYIDSLQRPHGFREEDFLLLNSLSGPTAVAIENDYLASKLN